MNETSILDYLDANGVICDESVAYAAQGEYPFTIREYYEWTGKVWDEVGGWDKAHEYAVADANFETYHIPFTRLGKQYWLNIMYGQGASWMAMTEAHYRECE